MTERISRIESLPGDISPKDSLAILDITLEDLVLGGVPEDVAREYLEIGTDSALNRQINNVYANTGSYFLYRDNAGNIQGILKSTPWGKVDEDNYSKNALDAVVRKIERKTVGERFSKARLGYQALAASEDSDKEQVIGMLIDNMLESRDSTDIYKDIVVPLHQSDPATVPAMQRGFNATGLKSEFVTLNIGGKLIQTPMKQELYVRKSEI